MGNMVQPAFGRLLASRIYRRPIFIIGGSRSGTSVLLQAVGKHTHILSTPGEAPLLTSMGGIVHYFEHADSRQRKYYNNSLRFKKEYLYQWLRRLSFEIAGGKNWGFKFLYSEMVRNPFKYFAKNRWAAKTFPSEKVAGGLLHLFPEAKFLYIVRNGIDVVTSSSKFHAFRDNSFEDNCRRWRNSIHSYSFLNRFESALILRHENLVTDPGKFFSSVCRFLGEPEEQGLSAFVEGTIVHPLDQETQKGVAVRDKLLSRPKGYLDWSLEQKELFKNLCGEAMAESGYEIPF
ncbi:MAG: sulfotransferase [Acidobacteria bacterium]|nr:sulfotransferase [Acidobacteriota bacterium]